jgi:regulator of protease activity HflC (stomatin/prohibitin superfamily)
MFGGMTYENPEIQKSIDNVFVAQQQKNVALAKYDAQKKENERVILEAQGVAEQKTITAEADAKQRQIQADAEAHAIATLTKSIADGGTNYLNYKQMEINLKQAERWDGSLPKITGGSVVPMLNAETFLNK